MVDVEKDLDHFVTSREFEMKVQVPNFLLSINRQGCLSHFSLRSCAAACQWPMGSYFILKRLAFFDNRKVNKPRYI